MANVCILTSAHSPFDVRIYHCEAESLKKMGLEVTIVAPWKNDKTTSNGIKMVHWESPWYPPYMGAALPQMVILPARCSLHHGNSQRAIKIQSIPIQNNRFERFSKAGFFLYRSALKIDADIYHFHDPDLLPWMLLLSKRGKRAIYDVHEYNANSILTKQWIPADFRAPISRITDWIEKKISAQFKAIITVNPHMEGIFRSVNQNVACVGNYPLPWFIEKCTPSEPPMPNLISYVGRLEKDRGYETIIKTMDII